MVKTTHAGSLPRSKELVDLIFGFAKRGAMVEGAKLARI